MKSKLQQVLKEDVHNRMGLELISSKGGVKHYSILEHEAQSDNDLTRHSYVIDVNTENLSKNHVALLLETIHEKAGHFYVGEGPIYGLKPEQGIIFVTTMLADEGSMTYRAFVDKVRGVREIFYQKLNI